MADNARRKLCNNSSLKWFIGILTSIISQHSVHMATKWDDNVYKFIHRATMRNCYYSSVIVCSLGVDIIITPQWAPQCVNNA